MTVPWRVVENAVCWALGPIHIALGIAVLLGGPKRFPPPTYEYVLAFTGGESWPYGIMWITAGIMMTFGRGWFRYLGVGVAIFICNLWAALFLVAAFKNPNAAFTATIAYGGYGLLNGLLFAMMSVYHAKGEGE